MCNKSGIREGHIMVSKNLRLCGFFLMDMFYTTFINKRLQDMSQLSFLSFLILCNRTNLVGESYITSKLFYYKKDVSYGVKT